MFFCSCSIDLRQDIKEKVRADIMERTGEDCIFIPSELGLVQHFRAAKEMAAPSNEAAEDRVSDPMSTIRKAVGSAIRGTAEEAPCS